ncbi:PDF receptor [Amphibalanus amphitrite]|uniref:PDF receptor n=1 Tax=Amphibalanus amphitrite TaxID=1232801 RepID=A0A6A4VF16_AMPAM|nr:PDF receptor [Amphibalanus amphitrite]
MTRAGAGSPSEYRRRSPLSRRRSLPSVGVGGSGPPELLSRLPSVLIGGGETGGPTDRAGIPEHQLTDELQLPDELQLSEEDLQLLQLPDHQLDVLLQQLQAAEPANGSRWSAAATTSERRRQCDEQGAGPPPPNHCRLTWDEALCWPESPPGTLVLLPCFKEFRGIIYPKGGNSKCRGFVEREHSENA